LEKIKEDIDKRLSIIDKLIYRNKTQFDNLNSKLTKYETIIKAIPVIPKYKISYHVYKALVNVDTEIERDYSEIDDIIKLKDIEKRTKNEVSEIDDKLDTILQLVDFVKKSMEKEKKLIKTIEDYKNEIGIIKEIFDTKDLLEISEKFEGTVLRIEKEYMDIDPLKLEETEEDPTSIIERWNEVLNLAKIEVSNEWDRYQKETLNYTSKIDNILKIVKLDPKEMESVEKLNNNIKNIVSNPISKSQPSSEIESLKTQLSTDLEIFLKKILKGEELPVLEIIQSIKEKTKWIDYNEIRKRALKNGINESDFEQALNGLIDKGYLQRGYSLL